MSAGEPTAVAMSGGLDSSIITALAARHDAALNCYTIKFRSEDSSFEAMPDDARYARIVARQLGLPLHEIEIAPDIVDLLPRNPSGKILKRMLREQFPGPAPE